MDERIEILNKFMKNKDERLVVRKNRDKEIVYLRFIDEIAREWTIAAIEESTGQLYDYEIDKYAPAELFCYLSRFKEIFKKAYNDLFNSPLYYELEQLKNLTQEPLKTKDIKEENKIDILKNYMKNLDNNFLVEEHDGLVNLDYKDDKYWNVSTYVISDKKFIIHPYLHGTKHYNVMMYYYKNFVDKVKELF